MSILDSIIENTNSNNIAKLPAIAQQTVIGDHYFYDVEKAPLSGPYGDIEHKKGIFVNQKCINVVSNSYEVHQPSEIYQTFLDVSAKTGLQVNRVLTNKHNGGFLLSAKYDSVKIAGESHDANLVFYTSHCG